MSLSIRDLYSPVPSQKGLSNNDIITLEGMPCQYPTIYSGKSERTISTCRDVIYRVPGAVGPRQLVYPTVAKPLLRRVDAINHVPTALT